MLKIKSQGPCPCPCKLFSELLTFGQLAFSVLDLSISVRGGRGRREWRWFEIMRRRVVFVYFCLFLLIVIPKL